MRFLTQGLSKDAKSILDVGSAACPYLDWFPDISDKVSLDLNFPYDGPGVTPIKADFLEWQPGRRFDIVTCLQVLEHVPRADLFAQKLLTVGEIVVVSVPFEWEKGRTGSHVHDPVTKEKTRGWFGRKPNFEYICHEVTSESPRLVQVYDRTGIRWQNLKARRLKVERRNGEAAVSTVLGLPLTARAKAAPRKDAKAAERGGVSSLLRRVGSRLGLQRNA